MDERQIFVLAETALLHVIEQIADDQWELPIPEWFPVGRRQDDLTLRKLVDYHAYDSAWVPDMLDGKTIDEVGKDRYSGPLLDDDVKGNFAALAYRASEAALALDDLDKTVHTSFGDYPAREYFWQITTFRGLRAHDIAKLIGAETRLPDDLVQGLWDEIAPHAEEWRAIGVYGPAVEVPETASLQDRMLGLTGRQPDATGTF